MQGTILPVGEAIRPASGPDLEPEPRTPSRMAQAQRIGVPEP
jgi:hypothetical protein